MKKLDLKFWLILLAELLIAMAIFIAASEWQAQDMLDTDSKLPSLTAQTLAGETIVFPNKLGEEKQTLIYFFAPWCTICHLSIENLNDIDQGDALQILIVALDYQNIQEVEEFIDNHDLDYPVLLGDSRWLNSYRVMAFPSYYLIDKQGTVASRSMGYSTSLGMLARIKINN